MKYTGGREVYYTVLYVFVSDRMVRLRHSQHLARCRSLASHTDIRFVTTQVDRTK